ncbi:AAWKG family protein [Streptomyces sp. Edi2]|uniref:AAWKG family protein n=1 Tax=Streptomyces sp. Edi2 TaxID=3162528 RepID=UPI0033058704
MAIDRVPMSPDNDDWHNVVETFTGYKAPTVEQIFSSLTSSDGIPLMHVTIGEPDDGKIPDVADTDWTLKNLGNQIQVLEFVLPFYINDGGAKKRQAKIQLLGDRTHDAGGKLTPDVKNNGGTTGEFPGKDDTDKKTWDTRDLDRYSFGTGHALNWLLEKESGTRDFDWSPAIPESNYVDLSSFEATAKSFDRVQNFVGERKAQLDGWEKVLGAVENDNWKGEAAGVWWNLVHFLVRRYERIVEDMENTAGKSYGSRQGAAVRAAGEVLRKEAQQLYDAWELWSTGRRSNPLFLLSEILSDVMDNVWNKNIFMLKEHSSSSSNGYNSVSGGYKPDTKSLVTMSGFENQAEDGYGHKYGALDSVATWKAIGEEARNRWWDGVREYLGKPAEAAMRNVTNAWNAHNFDIGDIRPPRGEDLKSTLREDQAFKDKSDAKKDKDEQNRLNKENQAKMDAWNKKQEEQREKDKAEADRIREEERKHQKEQEDKADRQREEDRRRQDEQQHKQEELQKEQEEKQAEQEKKQEAKQEEQEKKQEEQQKEQEAKQEEQQHKQEEKQAEQEKKQEELQKKQEAKQEEQQRHQEQRQDEQALQQRIMQEQQRKDQEKKEKEQEAKQAEQQRKQEELQKEQEAKQEEQQHKQEEKQAEQEKKQEEQQKKQEEKQAEQEKKQEAKQEEQEKKQEEQQKEQEAKQEEQQHKQEEEQAEQEKKQEELQKKQEAKQEEQQRHQEQRQDEQQNKQEELRKEQEKKQEELQNKQQQRQEELQNKQQQRQDELQHKQEQYRNQAGDILGRQHDGSSYGDHQSHLPDSITGPVNGDDSLTNPGGSHSHVDSHGRVVTEYPDHSRTMIDPQTQTSTVTGPDGSVHSGPLNAGDVLTNPDGSVSHLDSQGQVVTEYPDGSRSTVDPHTGATSLMSPDGTTNSGYLNGGSGPDTPHAGPGGSRSHVGQQPDYEQELYDPQPGGQSGAGSAAAGLGGPSSGAGGAPGGMPMSPGMMGGGMGGMGGGGRGSEGGPSERTRTVIDGGDVVSNRRRPANSRAGNGRYGEGEAVVNTSSGSPFSTPMGGGHGGPDRQQTQSGDREREAWMPEDEDVWGSDEGGAPAVIGR